MRMNKIIFKKTACTFFLLACFINTVYGQTSFYEKLADSTLTLTKQKVKYDPTYFTLKYPNGDVPSDKGVCTEVAIRAYRNLASIFKKMCMKSCMMILKYILSVGECPDRIKILITGVCQI